MCGLKVLLLFLAIIATCQACGSTRSHHFNNPDSLMRRMRDNNPQDLTRPKLLAMSWPELPAKLWAELWFHVLLTVFNFCRLLMRFGLFENSLLRKLQLVNRIVVGA